MSQRIFKYEDRKGRKPAFNVKTSLGDDEAIKLLGGSDGDTFASKCAREIEKSAKGFCESANMLAWGFKLAEEAANPIVGMTLSESVLSLVRFRKPLSGEAHGEPFKVALCGDRSKHAGKYAITDGGPFRANRFYGYADPSGEWTPYRGTPQSVIDALTGGK